MAFRGMMTTTVRLAARAAHPWAAVAVGLRGISGTSSGVGLSAEGNTILELLLKTETNAEALYTELVQKSKSEGFRTIFGMLAREEAKHTEWIRQLARDGVLGPAVKQNDEILGDINKIVEAMKEARKNLTHLASKPDYTEQIDLYRMVTKMEAESAEFYKARAEIAQDAALRKLLQTIAAEEARHHRLLNGLLQFVLEDDECREMEQPNFWVRARTHTLGEMAKI